MSAEDKEKQHEYSASNIQVLEGLEAVRKRPAMYIGDISAKGLHHLVYEVVDNSIDEALAGYATHIEVIINGDNSITEYSCGKPTTQLQVIGNSDQTGTTVTFKPDASIFTETVYDYNTLAVRLRDLAFLNAGITLSLTDMRHVDVEGNPRRDVFYSKDGLREFVEYIDSNKESLINDVIHLNTERFSNLSSKVRPRQNLETAR